MVPPILGASVHRLVRAICVFGLFTLLAPEAAAQLTLRPSGLDLGVGWFLGSQSGPSRASSGPMVNALFTWRVDSLGSGTLLTALSASTQASVGTLSICGVQPGGGCADDFPNLRVLSVLVGWGYQEARGGPALRAMLGPALVRAEQENAFGLQTRVDLSSAALGRVSLVGWLQFLLMPDLLGQRAGTQAFGVALRVQ